MSIPTHPTLADAVHDARIGTARVGAPLVGVIPGASATRIEQFHPGRFARAPHRTGFFTLVLLRSGRGRYTLDAAEHDAWPGTVYVARPGHVKSYAYTEPSTGWVVTFTEAFLKEHAHAGVFGALPFLVTEPVLTAIVAAEAFAALDDLAGRVAAAVARPSSVRSPLVAALLVALLLRVREALWDDPETASVPDAGDRAHAVVRSFRSDLEAGLRALVAGEAPAPPSVADLAAAQGLHPSHLSAVVKGVTGRTAGRWAAEALAAEARGLLVDPDASVKEAAYRLGFSEPAAFSRFFRRETGESPTTFQAGVRPV